MRERSKNKPENEGDYMKLCAFQSEQLNNLIQHCIACGWIVNSKQFATEIVGYGSQASLSVIRQNLRNGNPLPLKFIDKIVRNPKLSVTAEYFHIHHWSLVVEHKMLKEKYLRVLERLATTQQFLEEKTTQLDLVLSSQIKMFAEEE